MSQSDTKNLRKLVRGLDAADIISIMESLHAAAASGQLTMTGPTDPQAKQAVFEAAIGLLEEDRAKLDIVLGALKERLNGLHAGTALSSSSPIITSPPASPTELPPEPKPATEAISEGADAPMEAAPRHVNGEVAATPAQYYFCDTCELWAKPGVPHKCTPDGLAEACFNGFRDEELDIIHDGPDGWEEIDPATTADGSVSQPQAPDNNAKLEAHQNNGSLNHDEAEDDETEPSDDLLRHHSKLERVYKMVKELIEENGPMHIDGMLGPASKRGLFIGVQNPRSNLANFLSKLKARGLLVSDNRGFWSLPERRAG